MAKKSIIGLFLLSVAVWAFASSGGSDKKRAEQRSIVVNPYHKNSGFSLRAGRVYEPRFGLKSDLHTKLPTISAVLTYRKGNTIFIVPSSRKVASFGNSAGRSNLNALQFKINLHH